MPVPVPIRADSLSFNCVIETYTRPTLVPSRVIEILEKDPRTNILLPKLKKSIDQERAEGHSANSTNGSAELWIALFTQSSKGRQLECFLAVTDGPIDTYPVFIWCARSKAELDNSAIKAVIAQRINLLCAELFLHVDERRVYSVFAQDFVARAFAVCWERLSGVAVINEPYYHALFSLCSRQTLANAASIRFDSNVVLRPATIADLKKTRKLCYGFAKDSVSVQIQLHRRSTRLLTRPQYRNPSHCQTKTLRRKPTSLHQAISSGSVNSNKQERSPVSSP